jgi:hypothetical protein
MSNDSPVFVMCDAYKISRIWYIHKLHPLSTGKLYVFGVFCCESTFIFTNGEVCLIYDRSLNVQIQAMFNFLLIPMYAVYSVCNIRWMTWTCSCVAADQRCMAAAVRYTHIHIFLPT